MLKNRVATALVIVGLALSSALPSLAQSEDEEGDGVEVDYGDNTFTITGEEPMHSCVLLRDDSRRIIYLTILDIKRIEDGNRVPFGTWTTEATGALADAGEGECFVLGVEE